MRSKNYPQLPGAGRTRAGHHHGSHTPTSPEAILLGKMAHHTKQIRRECTRFEQSDKNVMLLPPAPMLILNFRVIDILFNLASKLCQFMDFSAQCLGHFHHSLSD